MMGEAGRRGLRIAAAIVAVLIVLALVLNKLAPGPSGPTGSAYATAPTGLAAYANLLSRSGYPVTRVRDAPSAAKLDPAGTAIVLDPTRLLNADGAALRRFVVAGGRLVVGGQNPQAWLPELLGDPPAWSDRGPRFSAPLLPTPETSGIKQVLSAGEGSWTHPHATLPIVGASGGALVTVASLGAGQILLIADPSPLENRLLDRADNAALGLALAGPARRPILFEEALHGYGAPNGLASLPERWKWALIGLLAAAAVWVASRIRRLAAPDPPAQPSLPPRREHVAALARALGRAGDPAAAVAPVREHARARLLQRAHLAADADPDEVAHAASQLGLDAGEAQALAQREPEGAPDDGDEQVLAVGRALVKLSGGRS